MCRWDNHFVAKQFSLRRNSPPNVNVDGATSQCNSCESLWNLSRSRVLLCAAAVIVLLTVHCCYCFGFCFTLPWVSTSFSFSVFFFSDLRLPFNLKAGRQKATTAKVTKRHATHAPMTTKRRNGKLFVCRRAFITNKKSHMFILYVVCTIVRLYIVYSHAINNNKCTFYYKWRNDIKNIE